MLVFTQSVRLTLCQAGHESIEESSKIVPLGAPFPFICLNLLDSYFAENRNTVCEWKTAFGFNRVLGKLG
jgi:hypothetical protein